jgi:hypothetical protein
MIMMSLMMCWPAAVMAETAPRSDASASIQTKTASMQHMPGFLPTARNRLDTYLDHRIRLFQSDPAKFVAAPRVEAPPGMPIGDDLDY